MITSLWGEHLAPGRARLLKVVKNDPNTDRVWTMDSKIYCTLKDDRPEQNKKYVLTCPEDLFRQLGWGEEKLEKSGLFLNLGFQDRFDPLSILDCLSVCGLNVNGLQSKLNDGTLDSYLINYDIL